MNFYLGVTDERWFRFLREIQHLEDVNFWRPGKTPFKALPQGGPFLFKLKGKTNKIVGLGFFYQFITLPILVAWDSFGPGNGFNQYGDFILAIEKLRSKEQEHNPELGCIVLTNPVFFKEDDWMDVPADWKSNIVSGSTYSTESAIGKQLWDAVESRLSKYLSNTIAKEHTLAAAMESSQPGYNLILSKIRIGQGAFRASVTDAYHRKCSITGEKTLPVLEAAHIKSYSKAGPNMASNGLLLRSDLHKLFDTGYLTVTTDYTVEVSSRIKSEFENGREYYQFHGKALKQLPDIVPLRPKPEFLIWHNENIYRG